MGTEANPATERDSGVATWVGGDMYVGKKSDNLTNADGPDASYSAEAEGLTVVNGKLMLHPRKNSWNGKGFVSALPASVRSIVPPKAAPHW